jgi:hypothetical protein
MATSSLWLNKLEKKADLKAHLRLIHYFGVFHDFGETGSGRLKEKGALDSRQ